jgi:transcriptional regulator with XRE-family HTH domain
MDDAGVTSRDLAYRVGVTAKQVERWLADARLTPHARNRADTAQALGVDENMIWPKAVQDRVKLGADREIIRTYPYRSACPSTVWADLTAGVESELFLAGYTNYFFWTQIPEFSATIRRKAEAGCRVRILLGDPEGEVTRQREAIEDVALAVSSRIRMTLGELARLGPVEGVEARFSAPEDAANHVSLSVFRFDEQALVTPHLARLVGHDSPMLHLRRHAESGMWSRFADHAEELWERGRAVPRA